MTVDNLVKREIASLRLSAQCREGGWEAVGTVGLELPLLISADQLPNLTAALLDERGVLLCLPCRL